MSPAGIPGVISIFATTEAWPEPDVSAMVNVAEVVVVGVKVIPEVTPELSTMSAVKSAVEAVQLTCVVSLIQFPN